MDIKYFVQTSVPLALNPTNSGLFNSGSWNASITVPAGHFNHVLKTLETSPLEPGVKEYKFYASGVGNISIWEDLKPNGQPTDRIELISVTHGPAAIPLPRAAWTGLAMMSALVLCGGVGSMLRHREMSIRRV